MEFSPKKEPKSINLRINSAKLALIDKATSLQKKDRTNFILDAAYKAAVNVILDRRLFLVDEQLFDKIENILNSPPQDLPKLKALLRKRAPWEN